MRTLPTTINAGQTITGSHNQVVIVPYDTINHGTIETNHQAATFDLSNQAVWNPYHTHVMAFINDNLIESVHGGNMAFRGTLSNNHFMCEVTNNGTILANGGSISFDAPVYQSATGTIDVINHGIVSFGRDFGTVNGGSILLNNGTLALSSQAFSSPVGGLFCGVASNTSIEFAGGKDVIQINGLGSILDSFNPATDMLSIFAHGQTAGGWTNIDNLQVKPAFGQHLTASNFSVSGGDLIFRPS